MRRLSPSIDRNLLLTFRKGDPISCSAGYQCAHDNLNQAFGCCSNLSDCTLQTTCYDSTIAAKLTGTANSYTQYW